MKIQKDNATGKVMPSVAQLIDKHSKAKVVLASQKQYIVSFDMATGLPNQLSRPMVRDDVILSMIRKYA